MKNIYSEAKGRNPFFLSNLWSFNAQTEGNKNEIKCKGYQLPVDELIWTGGKTKSCTNLVQCFFVYKWYWILVIEVVMSCIFFCFLLFYIVVILWLSACLLSFHLEDYIQELQILYWLQGRVNVRAFTPAPLAFLCLSNFCNTGISLWCYQRPYQGSPGTKTDNYKRILMFSAHFWVFGIGLSSTYHQKYWTGSTVLQRRKSSSPKEQLRLSLNNMKYWWRAGWYSSAFCSVFWLTALMLVAQSPLQWVLGQHDWHKHGSPPQRALHAIAKDCTGWFVRASPCSSSRGFQTQKLDPVVITHCISCKFFTES